MKKLFTSLFVFSLITITACQPAQQAPQADGVCNDTQASSGLIPVPVDPDCQNKQPAQ